MQRKVLLDAYKRAALAMETALYAERQQGPLSTSEKLDLVSDAALALAQAANELSIFDERFGGAQLDWTRGIGGRPVQSAGPSSTGRR